MPEHRPPKSGAGLYTAAPAGRNPAWQASFLGGRRHHGEQLVGIDLLAGRDVERTDHAVLGRAHGRLHFCGEHLATTSRGMEGAMESAEEAAAAILESL